MIIRRGTVNQIHFLIFKEVNNSGVYQAVHDESGRTKAVLSEYGIIPEDFDFIATDVNNRQNSSIVSQIRPFPEHGEKERRRKRGRPKKEKTEEASAEMKPKRGRGRPKGSKNKKTLEEEAKVDAGEQTLPRRLGRPKGSKNKPKVEETPESKRGRGRPKGSKDKQPRKRAERKSPDIGE